MNERTTLTATYRNTESLEWWHMLNAECQRRGIPDRTFEEAYEAYYSGHTPTTAAVYFLVTSSAK